MDELALLSLTAARDQVRGALSAAGKRKGDDDGQGARARARMARIDAVVLWSGAREAARLARWDELRVELGRTRRCGMRSEPSEEEAMRFKPEARDFVVQPDGRVFHVVPCAWSDGRTAYRVEYQERIHLKHRTEVCTYCRWPRLNQEHQREIVQALADRLEEEVRQARANTGGET